MTVKAGVLWGLLIIAVTILSYFLLKIVVKAQGLTMSIHGEIAMVLGVFFTLVVGVVLMLLLFYSNKSGHDARVHDSLGEQDE